MCCTDIDFYNTIWTTSMMGHANTGMNYYWPQIHMNNTVEHYQALSTFFQGENLNEENYTPKKWNNGLTVKGSDVENFYLVSEDKEKVLGWVHNASHYWRNYKDHLDCMDELIDNSGVVSNPCTRGDGQVIENYPYSADVYTYDNSWEDSHTDDGGADTYNGQFKINGLKIKVGPFTQTYRVEFFSTQTGELVDEQLVITDGIGGAVCNAPDLDLEDPGYAYKVFYEGNIFNPNPQVNDTDDQNNTNDQSMAKSATQIKEYTDSTDDAQISVYPNPSSGRWTVECDSDIEKISVYSLTGELIYSSLGQGYNRVILNLASIPSGIYELEVFTKNFTFKERIIKTDN